MVDVVVLFPGASSLEALCPPRGDIAQINKIPEPMITWVRTKKTLSTAAAKLWLPNICSSVASPMPFGLSRHHRAKAL